MKIQTAQTESKFDVKSDLNRTGQKISLPFEENFIGNCANAAKVCRQLLIKCLTVCCLSMILLPFGGGIEVSATNKFDYWWERNGNPRDVNLYVHSNTPASEYPFLKGRVQEWKVAESRYYEIRVIHRTSWNQTWYTEDRDDVNSVNVTSGEGSEMTTCNNETIFGRKREVYYGTWYFQTRTLQKKSLGAYSFWFCPRKDRFNSVGVGQYYEAKLEVKVREYNWASAWVTNETESNLIMRVYKVGYGNPDMIWSGGNPWVKSIVADGRQRYDDLYGYINVRNKPANVDRISAVQEKWSQTGESEGGTIAVIASTEEVLTHENWPGEERPLGKNLSYGTWYFSDNYRLFFFKPNSAAINTLLPGERVRSHATYSWLDFCTNCVGGLISADTARVELRGPTPVLSIESTAPSINEGEEQAMFTITSNMGPVGSIPITYVPVNTEGDFLDITGGEPGDVRTTEPIEFTQVGESGHYQAKLPVPIRADNDTPDTVGAITVTLSDGGLYRADPNSNSGIVRVFDADAELPTVSIDSVTQAEGNGGGDTLFQFKVSLSPAEALDFSFTVPVVFAHNTTDSQDFVGGTDPTALDVSFGTTDTEKTIDIMVKSDSDSEIHESFTLTLSDPTGDAADKGLVNLTESPSGIVGTGTVNNDDLASISIDDLTIAEDTGGENTRFRFTVGLSPATALNQTFTVPVAFAHGTTNSADFLNDADPSGLDVTFGTADTFKHVDISVKADAVGEFDETFTLTLSEPTGNAKDMNLVTLSTTPGATLGSGTVTDDDRAKLSISDAETVESSGSLGALLLFTVSLSPASAVNESFTVPVTFAHVTTDSTDFLGASDPSALDLTFEPTDISKTLYIKINGDTEVESDETFTLTLSDPTGDAMDNTLIVLSNEPGATVGTGTITNDDQERENCGSLICMAWDPGFHGNITYDGVAGNPRYVVASLDYRRPSNTGLSPRATERRGDVVLNTAGPEDWIDYVKDFEYPGFTDLSPKEYRYGPNFTYGTWYRKTTRSCPKGYCGKVMFVPNVENIKNLAEDEVITSTYYFILHSHSNGAEVASHSISVTIKSESKNNHVGFELASRNIEVAESGTATLSIVASSPVSEPISVPFTIADGSAVLDTDYTAPTATSVTIAAGESRGSFTIPLVQNSDTEPTKDFTISLGDGARYIVSPTASTARVTILDDDELTAGNIGNNKCHEVTQPASVSTPNTTAFWETYADKAYYEPHERFDIKMGFEDPVRVATKFYYGVYFDDGEPENDGLYKEPAVNSEVVDIRIGSPGNHRGFFRYRILPSEETDAKWYAIKEPCEFGVWWVEANRPGITISTDPETVFEGRSFSVIATATPAPRQDIIVPVSISDISRIEGPQNFDIRIRAGQTAGYRDVLTKIQSGDQSEDNLTVSTVWRSTYWLDDTAKSAIVTITDHEKAVASFKSENPDLAVSESGTAELVVKLVKPHSSDVTVKYQITDGTATGSDYNASLPREITIAAGDTEGTIRIPIVDDTDYEESESFTVEIVDSDSTLPASSNIEATVTVISDDALPVTTATSTCDAVPQPGSVTTPNTQAYWETIAEKAYYAWDEHIDIRMGFREAVRMGTKFYYGVYFHDNTAENDGLFEEVAAGSTGEDIRINRPGSHQGHFRYRVLKTDLADNRWYDVDSPCEFHVWWVDANKPGITLSVDKSHLEEGEAITVTATATPAPNRDIVVPFAFSDGARIGDSQVLEVLIEKDQTAGSKTVQTTFLTGDQQNDSLTVTAAERSSYWLDDDERSADFTFTERAETDASTLSIDDVSVAEGTGVGNTEIQFTVKLSPATAVGETFKVPITFSHVSTSSNDFVGDADPNNLEVNFGADDTEQTVSISINRDGRNEIDEAFTLTLSEPTGDAKDMNLATLSTIPDEIVGTGTITNDDQAIVSINSLTHMEGTGIGYTSFEFEVKLTPATAVGQTFTVPVDIALGTTDSSDFLTEVEQSDFDVSFATAETLKLVTVRVNQDDVNEGDETFTLTLSEPTGNAKDMNLVKLSATENVGTGTIANDDRILISINDLTLAEGTGTGSTNFEFKVALTPAESLDQDFSVPIAVDWGNTDASDFMGGTLPTVPASTVFNAADSVHERSIVISVNWDDAAESNETFTLTLLEPTGAAADMNLVAVSELENVGTGTITNDDGATISINDLTLMEDSNADGDTRFQFTVSLSPAVAVGQNFAVPLTFDYGTTDKFDFVDGDLDDFFDDNQTAVSPSVLFGNGETSRTVDIMVRSDEVNEGDESFTLTLSQPTEPPDPTDPNKSLQDTNIVSLSATPGSSIGEGRIVNDDRARVIINDVSLAENAGNGGSTQFRFTVSLSPAEALNQSFSVPVAFKHGTTDDADFVSGNLAAIPTQLEFSGTDTEKTIDILVNSDDADNEVETFTLTLSEPTGTAKDLNLVTLSATENVGTGTITTVNRAVVSIGNVSAEENSGSNGSTQFQFTLNLLPAVALSQEFYVPVAFAHGTTDDADFVAGSLASIPDRVKFEAGDTSATVDIMVDWDEDKEEDETFTLTLSEPTGAAKEMNLVTLSTTPGGNVGTGTIVDDDAPVVAAGNLTIDIPAVVYAFEKSGTAAITMSLSSMPATAIKMRATTIEITDATIAANLKAEAGTDFTGFSDREFDILTTQSSATLTVDILADTSPEQNESFLVAISTLSGATLIGADNTGERIVKVVIIDDDQYPTVEVSAVSQSITEGENAVFEIEANFHGKPSEDVVVHYQVSQTGDYLFIPVSRKIIVNSTTKMLKMPTVDNNADGNGGSVTLTLLEGDGYGYRPHPGKNSDSITIADNDNGSVKSPETLYSVVSAVITEILQSTGPTEATDSKLEPSRVTVSLFAVEKTVTEGDPIRIAVTVTGENHSGIKVSIGLRETGDYVDESEPAIVSIPSESNTVVHEIPTVDDDLSEADGIVTAFIMASDEYNLGDSATVEVKVTDEDDQLARRAQVSVAQQAVLSELAGNIGARSFGAMFLRMVQAFADSTGPELQLGGASTLNELLTSGARSIDAGSVSWEDLLGDSSFSFDLLPEGNGASTASVWGLGDFRSLSNGSASPANTPDGDVFTGHIGIDTRIGNSTVVGITSSIANAAADYGQGNGRINFQSRTTGFHPYVGWRSANEDNRLDIIAGYGLGEVGLDQVRYSAETLQSSFYNAGLSGSSRLYSDEAFLGGATSVSVTGDSWLARHFLKSEGGFVDSAQTKVSYARIAVAGAQEYELGRGGKFSAESRLGIGADEKANQSFIGLLLESELVYQNPFGLALAGDSVMVATNGGQVRELELTADMSFDRDGDERGLLLNLFREWNREFSATDKPLWHDSLLNNTVTGDGETDSRIEIGYGFDILDDSAVITPYSAFHQANTHGTEFRVGSRIATGKGHNFELEIGRDIPATGTRGHEVNLIGDIRW